MKRAAQRFSVEPGTWRIVRLDPRDPIPDWALESTEFLSITRTNDELSIVCSEAAVPAALRSGPRWSLLKVSGPIPLDEIGVLASLAEPLAAAGLGILAIGTFDTDYILVREGDLATACDALTGAGHGLLR